MKHYLNNFTKQLNESFILLADDDEDDRFLMHEFFTTNGFKGLIMDSGQTAMQFLRSLSALEYPSVIIVDYNMPLVSGEEVLKQMKSDEQLNQIPLIVYSSVMTDVLKNHLLSLGAFCCLKKASSMQQFSHLQHVLDGILQTDRIPGIGSAFHLLQLENGKL